MPRGIITWDRLIRPVDEVDPVICPRRGGTRKVLAVDEWLAAVRKIPDHLGLPTAPPSFRAPPDPTDGLPVDPTSEGSFGPLFRDLLVADPEIGWPGGAGACLPPPGS